jgi:hypothetical protein
MRYRDSEERRRRQERQRHEAEYRRRVEAQRKRRQLAEPEPECENEWIDSEGEFEPERTQIEIEEVIALLQSIEQHRAALAAHAATLSEWLSISDDLSRTWDRFTRMGGISAADFERFLAQRLPRRPVRQKRHLRLISSHELLRKRLITPREPPEAA